MFYGVTRGRPPMPNEPVVHVVDDDAAMRNALLVLLGTVGFQSQGYRAAEEFLAREESCRPVCLVVDVSLPGMSGLEFHDHLVSIGDFPATVIITGHGDIPMAVAALKAGVLDFLTKAVRSCCTPGERRQRIAASRGERATQGRGR